MTELPNGWVLGPLSDFVMPRGEKVSPKDFPALPFIGMDHVEANTTRIIGSVLSGELKSSAARFKKNDVIYGRLRPYLNKVAQPKFDGLASAEFIVFSGNGLVDPTFLLHRLNARDFVTFSSSLNAGDRPRVNFDQIGVFDILLPPLKEQRRIVEKIEAKFEEIDAGTQSLRAAQAKLGLYRQSLLKSAFEGRLTADWRAQNPDKLEDPETLLSRIQSERDTRYKAALDDWQKTLAKWREDGEQGKKPAKPKRPKDFVGSAIIPEGIKVLLPDQWLTLTMSDLGQTTGGLTKNQKRNTLPLKAKYLRVANVYSNRLELGEIMEIGVTKEELRKTTVETGDLLFVEGNGSIEQIGRVAIWDGSISNMTHQNHLIRFSADGLLSSRFALYFMMSPVGRKLIEAQASSTSGLHTLSISKIEGLPTPICSPAEQTEIVRILDVKLEAADALEAEIAAALTRAEALRQSILKKAFSGRLVPQDPNDEPASALLDRIKADRAAAPKTKRTRKTSV